MGTRRPRSVAHQAVVLDSGGALITFERNDKKVRTLIELASNTAARCMCLRESSPKSGEMGADRPASHAFWHPAYS